WTNGEPVTAPDFVYSWRRALLPDSASDYTGMFFLIRGGREFYDWRQAALAAFRPGDDGAAAARALWLETERRFAEMVGLEAIDSRTLRVELAEPTPYFLDLCAFAVFYPVYPPLVRAHESLDPQTGALKTEAGWTKPPHLIS